MLFDVRLNKIGRNIEKGWRERIPKLLSSVKRSSSLHSCMGIHRRRPSSLLAIEFLSFFLIVNIFCLKAVSGDHFSLILVGSERPCYHSISYVYLLISIGSPVIVLSKVSRYLGSDSSFRRHPKIPLMSMSAPLSHWQIAPLRSRIPQTDITGNCGHSF